MARFVCFMLKSEKKSWYFAYPSPPPGNFAGKRVLKLVERFSSQFFFYHRAVYRSYNSRPSDLDVKYLLAKFGHAQKAKLLFAFSPIFFRFSCLMFFLLLGI